MGQLIALTRAFVKAVMLFSSVFILVAPSWAADDTPSMSRLTAEWWQRVLSIPVASNPVDDTDGKLCMAGDSGPIWFLYGTFGGAAVRHCSVPQGRAIFFPVINQVVFNSPNICGQPNVSLDVATLRSYASPTIDAATNLTALVDGRAIKKINRVRSIPFSVAMPVDNILVGPCSQIRPPADNTSPPGVYSPGVDDGYYVLLDPLSTGPHTIKIHADSVSNGSPFSVDVTYYLVVVPVSLK
jgi:hypothetical protein